MATRQWATMLVLAIWGGAISALGLVGCGDDDPDGPSSVSASFEAGEAGEIEVGGGELRLEIPEGALAEAVEIRVERAGDAPGDGLSSEAWRLEPQGLVFEEPATLSMATNQAVDAGQWVYPSRLVDDQWQPIEQSIPRTELESEQTVSAHIESFSVFGIAADPAAPPAVEALAWARDDGADLYGYIDAQGDWAIEPQFTLVENFRDHMARVRLDDEDQTYAYINAQGRVVYRASDYDRARNDYRQGRVAVELGVDREAFADRQGEVVTSTFRQVRDFSEGLAAVQTRSDWEWGFIDDEGQWVIDAQFRGARNFSEGLAAVQTQVDGQSRWGYIDAQGEWVVEPQFAEVNPFREGLARVRLPQGDWGYIDTQGEVVIEAQFVNGQRLRPTGFAEGRARESTDGTNWGYIDETGQFVIDANYNDYLLDFSEGVAAVGDGSVGREHFIDPQGEVVISGEFDEPRSFSQGLAAARGDGALWGFLDSSGQFAIDARFDQVGNFYAVGRQ